MRYQLLEEALQALAGAPGLRGCAAVEPDSGLVLARAGEGDERLWEAAIDYWRMYRRLQDYFEPLGSLGAAVMYHAHGVLAVLPCAAQPPLLVVCLAGHGAADWIAVQRQIRALSGRLQSRE